MGRQALRGGLGLFRLARMGLAVPRRLFGISQGRSPALVSDPKVDCTGVRRGLPTIGVRLLATASAKTSYRSTVSTKA